MNPLVYSLTPYPQNQGKEFEQKHAKIAKPIRQAQGKAKASLSLEFYGFQHLGIFATGATISPFAVFVSFCSNIFIFLLFLIRFAPAEATTNTLTPDAVVQLALTHNPGLKGRYEDLNMATARLLQADAGLKPQLDTRAQAQHFEGLENGALGTGVTIPVMNDQYSASIGITQPLYTG